MSFSMPDASGLTGALTTLEGLKSQIGTDPNDDTLLNHLIDAASEKIERETGRRFAATDYVQWINGAGQDRIMLDQYPIIRVQTVGVGRCPRLSISYTGAAVQAAVIITADNLRLLTIATDGTNTTTDTALNSTTTISEVETAIDAVSGWSATTQTDGPSLHLMPSTNNLKSGDTVSVYGPDHWTYPSAIDIEAGTVMLDQVAWWPHHSKGEWYQGDWLGALRDWNSAGWGGYRVMVQYRAGYETIPADIDQIAREIAASMYYRVSQDPNLQSENLGGYSYTLANQIGVTDEMRAVLARYTREVIA